MMDSPTSAGHPFTYMDTEKALPPSKVSSVLLELLQIHHWMYRVICHFKGIIRKKFVGIAISDTYIAYMAPFLSKIAFHFFMFILWAVFIKNNNFRDLPTKEFIRVVPVCTD